MTRAAGTGPGGTPSLATSRDDERRARLLASYEPDALVDDPDLAAIVRFVGDLCDAPIALVSLVESERQRFLARVGIEARETPRDVSFCAHAMMFEDGMVVRDAQADERFAANPLVTGPPNIRFYAGQPLVSQDGTPLGSLCVIDTQARPDGLTTLQHEGLAVLAQAVVRRLEGQRLGRDVARNEARLRALADSIPDIAWSAGADGRPNYFNRRWFEFTGFPDGDLSAAGESVVHPEDYPVLRDKWAGCLAEGTTFEHENRLQRHDGEYRWMLHRAVPVRNDQGEVVQWFGTVTDIHEVRRLSESRDVLAKELSHRIKNIFAVIAGLVSLSARTRPEHKPFADELTDTIRALGRAHDFVRASGDTTRDSLHGLLAELFAPYGSGDRSRVRVAGHDCAVDSRAATPLALVFHELATNSAKYGALASDHGHVDLKITEAGDMIHLVWVEHGGKPPSDTQEPGFGSRLVEMSITGQLGGTWERHFEADGMTARLALSTEKVCGCEA